MPNLQQIPVTNKDFLTGIFGEFAPFAHVCLFPDPPDELDKRGKRWAWGGDAAYRQDIERDDCNTFFTISIFDPLDNGKHVRRKDNFKAGFCVMIDDIGTGSGAKIDPTDFMLAGAPEPSWVIETSEGNFQYGYIFEHPEQNRHRVDSLLEGFIALNLIDGGGDPGMLGVTRYCRLPIGVNNKTKYPRPFNHQLTEWRPDRKYSIDAIAAAFGITLHDTGEYEDGYATPLDPEHDLALASLQRLGLFKRQKQPGEYEITCPWHRGHTEALDNGSMYFSPIGYKCHHGSCLNRRGPDLLNWLRGTDPEYAKALDAAIPFVPVEQTSAPVLTLVQPSDAPPSDYHQLCDRAVKVNERTPIEDVEAIYRDIVRATLSPAAEEDVLQILSKSKRVTMLSARKSVASFKRNNERVSLKSGRFGSPRWKDRDPETGEPLGTGDNFEAMLDFHGVELRYNEMSHSAEANLPGIEVGEDDTENQQLAEMQDMLVRYKIPYQRCDQFANRIAHKNSYHPFVDYLDHAANTVPYDPSLPIFSKVFGTIGLDDADPADAQTLVLKWMISVVAAARGHMGYGMKGVLVFSGPQNIGKTSWFRYLMPDRMFGEALHLDPTNKDTMMKGTKYLVSELGEIDSTFRKADISMLKGFISALTDELREPYARKVVSRPRRTAFCGTVNEVEFLRDQTGNSRFWPIAVESFDLDTMRAIHQSTELPQLWREIDACYAAFAAGDARFFWGIGAGDDSKDVLDRLSERHQEVTPVEELLRSRFDFDAPCVMAMTISEIAYAIGLDANRFATGGSRSVSDMRAALTKLTGQRDSKQRKVEGQNKRAWFMPPEIVTDLNPKLPFKPMLELVPRPVTDDDDYDWL